MFATRSGNYVAALSIFLSAGCSGSAEADKKSPQSHANIQTEGEKTTDVNTTALQDANYATRSLLEARKAGLAKESAELADPAKVGTIDPIATDPYTRADYPDVVRQWGKLIPTINKERKIAAQIAARDPRCDGVVNAQVTDGGSRDNRHYMTECNNLTRIYFDTTSLAHKRAAVVRTQADMGAQGVLNW